MPATLANCDATIVITTKNRKEELHQALNSCLIQTAAVEILVVDDGSTDGTTEMVRSRFPQVRIERRNESQGLIVRRNEAAQLASGAVVFSIDDDAKFSSPHIVAQTLAEFDNPYVGAIAIPFINVRQDSIVRQLAANSIGIHVTFAYIGTAHAVRRNLFLQLGGYREYLFHQGEESDFCTRMLQFGFVTRLGRADPVIHFESLKRDMRRMDIYGRRNDVLYAWYHVPMPYYLVHATANTFNGLFFGIKRGRLWRTLLGTLKGIAGCVHEFSKRAPVSFAIYRLSRRLKKRPLLLQNIEKLLPPPFVDTRTLQPVIKSPSRKELSETGEAVRSGAVAYCATVVVTTRNRRDELRTAIRSVVDQTVLLEILVMDDASSDGTAEMVRTEFPQVCLFSSPASLGYIVQRNRAAALARAPILFSIDDDAVFAACDVVERTLAEFSSPRIGAVAIPQVDVVKNQMINQPAPANGGVYVTESFVGTAHALRRDLFLRLGGYRESLVHQGEEGDYCLRMLNAGYVTRVASAGFIHHFESPRRDFRRMDFYGRRNDVLFAWHNVPMPFFPAHLLVNTLKGLLFSLEVQRPIGMMRGLLDGLLFCLKNWSARAPVSCRIYRLHRRLRKRGPLQLQTFEMLLPPIADGLFGRAEAVNRSEEGNSASDVSQPCSTRP